MKSFRAPTGKFCDFYLPSSFSIFYLLCNFFGAAENELEASPHVLLYRKKVCLEAGWLALEELRDAFRVDAVYEVCK